MSIGKKKILQYQEFDVESPRSSEQTQSSQNEFAKGDVEMRDLSLHETSANQSTVDQLREIHN